MNVPVGMECPRCGESKAHWIIRIHNADGWMRCVTCGQEYRPNKADAPHDCSTCAFADYHPATSGAAHLGQAPEEAVYECCLSDLVTEEHELEDCRWWIETLWTRAGIQCSTTRREHARQV